ncbi:MAG: medium chain dehydrogenase/reductase family protein [Acidobacteriota bacterium]
MRAVRIEKTGPPEVLVERELPVPRPAEGEVSIRVEFSGVNFADLLQRLGLYGHAPKRPYVPGFEVAGYVEAVGLGVRQIRPGQRVAALTRFGGYAETVVAPESSVFRLPRHVSLAAAAALPVNFLTAWFCLYRLANVRRRESVLITAAGGGVGTAAVQLAHSTGCNTFAVTGSSHKVMRLKELGADYVIDASREDVAEVVARETAPHGLDVLLDSVGGETLRRLIPLVGPLGRVVTYGMSAAAPSAARRWWAALQSYWKMPRFTPLQLIERNIGVFGFHLGLLESRKEEVRSAFEQILALTAARRVAPAIDRVFPLTAQGAAEAHRYLHERRNFGKVLLSPRLDRPVSAAELRQGHSEP